MPDLDILIERYEARDEAYFRGIGKGVLARINAAALPGAAWSIHNLFVSWLASYSGRLDTAGGPIVDRLLVDTQLSTLTKYEFRDWCVSLLEPGRVYAHICVYDYDELHGSLRQAGFTNIQRVALDESQCSDMIGLDRKEHDSYSLYVEAVK